MEEKEQSTLELEQREQALIQREEALAKKERQHRAREALADCGLPQDLLSHLDLSSDEGLSASLALAREAGRQTARVATGAPKARGMSGKPDGGYAQRALLYQTDRNDYLEQYKGVE